MSGWMSRVLERVDCGCVKVRGSTSPDDLSYIIVP
jgi:hypothetical protein